MLDVEINPDWPSWRKRIYQAIKEGNVTSLIVRDTSNISVHKEKTENDKLKLLLAFLESVPDTVTVDAGEGTVLKFTVEAGIPRSEKFYAEAIISVLEAVDKAKDYTPDKSNPPITGVTPRRLDEWD